MADDLETMIYEHDGKFWVETQFDFFGPTDSEPGSPTTFAGGQVHRHGPFDTEAEAEKFIQNITSKRKK